MCQSDVCLLDVFMNSVLGKSIILFKPSGTIVFVIQVCSLGPPNHFLDGLGTILWSNISRNQLNSLATSPQGRGKHFHISEI